MSRSSSEIAAFASLGTADSLIQRAAPDPTVSIKNSISTKYPIRKNFDGNEALPILNFKNLFLFGRGIVT
jgi:hypothetical protein